jgi:steroid 5-alpha reductase family enzyme
MNSLVKTTFLLIFTLMVVPIVTFYLDEPLIPLQKNTLQHLLAGAIGVALMCYIVSEITGNCSQVDKLWSVVPVFYAWYMAYRGAFDERLVLMASLVTVWGIRLTYNFSRRGAYKLKFWTGEEDYRWEVLRQSPALKGRLKWSLFNLFFISLYQNGLILLFTLPMLVAYKSIGQALHITEYILAAIFIILVVMEALADQQQWIYQNEKHRRLKANIKPDGIYMKGFVHTGLWAKVRHPNYACEQAIWIVFYLFSVVATGQVINWSMAGCLLLLILFLGSSDFSENISAGKYPSYKDYQKQVGRFFPKLLKNKR